MRVWSASKQYPFRIENIFIGVLLLTAAYVKGKQALTDVREGAPGTRVSRYPERGTGQWHLGSTRYWVPGIDEVLGTQDRRGTG